METAAPMRKSALENASTLLVSRLGMAVLAWTGTLFIVGALSEDHWGRFSFVFSLLGMVAVVTDLGVGRVALAEVMPDQPNRARAAGNYIALRAVLGVLGYAIALAIVLLGGYDSLVVRATVVGGATLLVTTLVSAVSIGFQAAERMGHIALSSLVVQIAQLGMIIAISLRGGGLLWFVVATVARDLLLLPWRAWRAKALLPVRWEFDRGFYGRVLTEALPLSIGAILQNLWWRLDSVMLSRLGTFEDVGIYGVAYKFADLAHAAPLAMSAALMAPMVRAWPNDMASFRAAFVRGGEVLLLLAGYAVVHMLLFADDFIDLFFPDAYLSGVGTAQLLVLAEVGAFMAVLAFTTLIAAGQHRVYPVVALVGLSLNVALNLWLIPEHGFVGAAFATLGTELLVAVMLLVAVHKMVDLGGPVFFRVSQLVVVMAASGSTGWLAQRLGLPLLVATAGASLAFIGAAIMTGYPAVFRAFLAGEPMEHRSA